MCVRLSASMFVVIRTESVLVSINKWCFIKSHWLLLMPLSPALMLDTSKMVEMYNDKMKKNNKKSILLAHWALNDGTSRREGIASNRMTLSFNCWINIIFLAIFYHLRNSMDSVLCSSQCLCALALNEQIHYIEVVKWPLGTISFIFIYYYLSSWSAATSERAHQRHGNWLNAY